jgi:glycosyltransferase involved in cell wall biosynthesis
MKRAVHIYLSTFEHESRILKEVITLIDSKIVDAILIIAVWKEGLMEEETIYPGIRVKRIKLGSFDIIKNVKIILTYFGFSYSTKTTFEGDTISNGEEFNSNKSFSGISPFRRFKVNLVKMGYFIVTGFLDIIRTLRICLIIIRFNPNFLNIHHVDLLNLSALKGILRNMKVIYDTHELETETQGCVGIVGEKRRSREAKYIKYVDFTIVVTPSIEVWYRNMYNLVNITTVRNVPFYQDVSEFDKNYYKNKFNLKLDDVVFLYQGALFTGRGLMHLLKSFAQINDPKYSIVFMGYGEFKNTICEYASKYSNIFYHDPVPPDRILQHTVSADVGIALTENVCLSYYYGLGNKIFEYTMAEVPLMVSNMLDMATYVSSNKIGWVVESFEIEDIVQSIKEIPCQISPELIENIRNAKKVNNWEVESTYMIEAYKSLSN